MASLEELVKESEVKPVTGTQYVFANGRIR